MEGGALQLLQLRLCEMQGGVEGCWQQVQPGRQHGVLHQRPARSHTPCDAVPLLIPLLEYKSTARAAIQPEQPGQSVDVGKWLCTSPRSFSISRNSMTTMRSSTSPDASSFLYFKPSPACYYKSLLRYPDLALATINNFFIMQSSGE